MDKGKEFSNDKFSAMLKLYDIEQFSSRNKEIKCSVVERFNRTLKTRMYFASKPTNRYIDVLQDLVMSYNLSVHCSIDASAAYVTAKLHGARIKSHSSFLHYGVHIVIFLYHIAKQCFQSEYPLNSAGECKVHLARPIQLKSDYKVALSEIQYPRNSDTLNAFCNKVWYNDWTGFIEACIDQGYYLSHKPD